MWHIAPKQRNPDMNPTAALVRTFAIAVAFLVVAPGGGGREPPTIQR